MNWIIGALCLVIVICVITIAVVLYNFMLLLSELNKRQVYIISDILQSIDLSTPHLDSLQPVESQQSVEDILGEITPEDNYFNPHEFEIEEREEY
jgi:hypothetical protein